MKKKIFIEAICYAFFILFVYTGASKITAYQMYLEDLDRSPLLGPYALFIAIFIPLAELVIAGILMFPKTRKTGLKGALVLMMFFTVYVGYVLAMRTERPCTCGGIIRALSWPNHMIFNIVFTLLAAVGLWLSKTDSSSYKTTHAILDK